MVRVTLQRREIRRFLKSVQMQRLMWDAAEQIADNADRELYAPSVAVGRDRARGYVFPKSAKARAHQAKTHALERAVGRS